MSAPHNREDAGGIVTATVALGLALLMAGIAIASLIGMAWESLP